MKNPMDQPPPNPSTIAIKIRNPLPGLIMVLLSFLAGWYVTRFLWEAFSRGFVPGKLGAIHYAWSAQYTVSVAACVLGLVFVIALSIMGLRFAGLIRQGTDKPQ
jgi:hypothetical protein